MSSKEVGGGIASQAKRLDGTQQHQSMASPPRKAEETF